MFENVCGGAADRSSGEPIRNEGIHAEGTSASPKDRSRITVELTHPQPTIIVCAVTGTITTDTAPILSEALAQSQGAKHAHHLIIDLSAVTLLDSDGLYTLLVARHHGTSSGIHFALVINPHCPTIAELYLVSLQASFEVYDSLPAALEACTNTPPDT